jgi:hypothetical protein
LGSRDFPEGGYHIRSQTLKKSIGQQWQLTCWISSTAKRTILFSEMWHGTSSNFSTYISLAMCS